jgi:multicomponent Na+:H+ antiporter subunit B
MRDEKSLLLNVLALAIVAVLISFIYSAATSSDPGVKLLEEYKMEERVSDAYIHKNVLDPQATYEWNGTAEETSANIVTSVLANYRLFDTTLEVIVLFITVLAFGLVLPEQKVQVKPASHILSSWAPILIVFMLLVGGYLFINGHVSPGGGFPAGAMLSSAC